MLLIACLSFCTRELMVQNFEFISNPSWRQAFVTSSVKLVEDVGLDGLDVSRWSTMPSRPLYGCLSSDQVRLALTTDRL